MTEERKEIIDKIYKQINEKKRKYTDYMIHLMNENNI